MLVKAGIELILTLHPAEPPPKRTRRKKVAETAPESPQDEDLPVKPRRKRKSSTEVDKVPESSDAEVKPKRTRRKKTAASEDAGNGEVTVDPPPPKKRARRTAKVDDSDGVGATDLRCLRAYLTGVGFS